MSVLIISIIFLIGCTKGGVVIPNPLEPRVPQFSIPVVDTVFFGKDVDISYSVTNATRLTINDSIVPLSGVFRLSGVRANTSLAFVATYDKSEKTAMQHIPVPIFGEYKSILMFTPPGKTGVWKSTKRETYDSAQRAWRIAGNPFCQPTLFKRNGYTTWFNGLCNPGQPNSESPYSLSEDGKSILWNGVAYNVVFENDTTLVRFFTNNLNQTFRETFLKN